MTSGNTFLSAMGADDERGVSNPRAWADLDELSFSPTSRVLRRSEREIQIERAENAVIVADLPEFVIAQLHRHREQRRSTDAGDAAASAAGRRDQDHDPGDARRTKVHRTDVRHSDVYRADVDQGERTDVCHNDDHQTHADRSERADLHQRERTDVDQRDVDRDRIVHDDVGRVLRSLTRAGYLVRRDANALATSATGRMVALEPDLAALDDRFGRRASAVLDRRHGAGVRVHGTGRMAPLVAALLAAAGVGQVCVPDTGNVTLDDVLPGGLLPVDEGQRTALAAAEAVRRARPAGSGPPQVAGAGDLVISTDGYPVPALLRAELIAEPRPHLVAGVWGSHGVIGPLIVPGQTSCLYCADLHRRDRDPAWPALSTQLTRSGRPSGPSEVAVCTLTAAVTVVQALAFLDGERPATADGTLEFRLPDWRLRRRHWARHAHCPCAA